MIDDEVSALVTTTHHVTTHQESWSRSDYMPGVEELDSLIEKLRARVASENYVEVGPVGYTVTITAYVRGLPREAGVVGALPDNVLSVTTNGD